MEAHSNHLWNYPHIQKNKKTKTNHQFAKLPLNSVWCCLIFILQNRSLQTTGRFHNGTLSVFFHGIEPDSATLLFCICWIKLLLDPCVLMHWAFKSLSALRAPSVTSSVFHSHSSAGSFAWDFIDFNTSDVLPCTVWNFRPLCLWTRFLSWPKPHPGALETAPSRSAGGARKTLGRPPRARSVAKRARRARAPHQGERASSYANALSWLQISGKRAPPAGRVRT